MSSKENTKIKLSPKEKVFYIGVYVLVGAVALSLLYPMIYVISASISSPSAVVSGQVVLWPVDFSLDGYKAVLRNEKVFIGFRNSLFYLVVGTTFNMVMTVLAAYPLSRKQMYGRGVIMFLFTVTMVFGAGMIPNYLLMKNLGLLNTVWVMILPGGISAYNMIVMRTFFMTNIPDELYEAAMLDGCSEFAFLRKIVLPLSKAVFAVIVMYYAVEHWNSYFNAFLYLSDDKLYPLSLFLREILLASAQASSKLEDVAADTVGLENVLKYALIVVSMAPMVIIYPFVQRYFKKGVMVGSVKG